MKRSIAGTAVGLALLQWASMAHGLTSVHLWSLGFGGVYADVGNALANDATGNVFVTGYFTGTVSFGGGSLVSAGGSQDIFLAKYGPTGAHLWSKGFGDTSVDAGYAVAVDWAGNVLVTGNFSGTVNFGGGDLVSGGSGLGQDIFLAKYSPSGAHLWSRQFGSGNTNVGRGLALDASGNVFMTGTFRESVDFGGGNLVSAGSADIVLAKYSDAGSHLWSQRFGDTSFDNGYGVSVDISGNVFATGTFRGTANFGGDSLVSAGLNDIYIAKYNAAGTHQWSRCFGSTGDDFGYSVAADGSGSVFACGVFAGTVDFGGGGLSAAGPGDAFLAKYSATGVHEWSRKSGGAGFERGYAVAVNDQDDVFMTGLFEQAVDFGGGNLVSAGSADVFLAKFAPAGTHLWSRRFGGASTDYGIGAAVLGSGDVVATGFFRGLMNCGGADLVNAGLEDVFLAKYGGDTTEPIIQAITDVAGDQGRQIRIQFSRSYYDAVGSATPVMRYAAFRRDDIAPSSSSLRDLAGFTDRQLLDAGWTEVGSVGAYTTNSYGVIVPTIGDSTTALGQYYSAFFIRAATATPETFFDSLPDSGYSLDNLAPERPAHLAYVTGSLRWNKSNATDFDYFSVYGSSTESFATATLVDYCLTLTMDVSTSPYVFYFVTATDFSGNEGQPAIINALTGADGTPTSYVLSISTYPNPFNPVATIHYTVPSKGRVTLTIYDSLGSRVATLVDDERSAGAYTWTWHGVDDRGRKVASGVYFARVTHARGTKSCKMVLLK